MKKTWQRMGLFFAVAMVLMFVGCSSDKDKGTEAEPTATTAPSPTGNGGEEKPEEWTELNQQEITAAMGMGWNLGNQMESANGGYPSEIAWGNPVITEPLIKSVKEQGFGTVRIPVSYLLKIGEAPDYTINELWLDRIQQVVDLVISNDMYAIINIHGDGYYTVDKSWLLCAEDDEAQKVIKDKYEKVWAQIAERFKNYDEHLIFESMNEEFDNTYGRPDAKAYENINAYNQIFVDTVRKTGANNEKRWLLLPGWNTNVEYTAGNYGFRIPEDRLCKADGKRLMISVHFYDPYNFTLDENMSTATTQWGKYAVEKFDNWGQESHVDNTMKMLNDAFVSKGYPVIIGELGVQNKEHISESFGEFRRYWLEYVVTAAKKNGCIPVYWDNGWNGEKGFGLFDRTTGEVTEPELIAAMMRAINAKEEYEIAAPAGFEAK